jgi:hypothetical protein
MGFGLLREIIEKHLPGLLANFEKMLAVSTEINKERSMVKLSPRSGTPCLLRKNPKTPSPRTWPISAFHHSRKSQAIPRW